MTRTVAVVGTASAVGRASLARLAAADEPARVVAIGPDGLAMPPGRVEIRAMDARDRLLPLALEGIDVVVHCAFAEDLAASPDSLYGSNVRGTRNVLEAAAKAGISHLVVLSDAMAYGAHHDNPLPLAESAPLRANPGFAYAYQRQLVEELVAEWALEHPSTTTTVLRHAPLLGGGVDSALVRRLQAPGVVVPVGAGAPWQFVDVEDVASAVEMVVSRGIGGTFNVAADGWLSTDEVAAYLGRPVWQWPQATLEGVLRQASAIGLAPAPAEVMPYLLHPWVLDNDALRRLGWHAARSNRELLAAFAADHADEVALGSAVLSRQGLRRTIAAAGLLVALTLWRLLRR